MAFSKIKITSEKKFLLATAAICLFWFLALYPARLGADYSALLNMIRQGESTDWWTANYYWFFRITSFNGYLPEVTAGLQLAILASSLIWFIESLPGSPETKRKVSIISLCSPLFGFFGMTISHDLTQTAGILLLCGIEIRRVGSGKEEKFLGHIFLVAIPLVMTTHSGLLIALLALSILAIRNMKKEFGYAILIVLICVFVSSIGVGKVLDVNGAILKTNQIKYWPSLNVLKCIAQHPMADISEKEWLVLGKVAPQELWKQPVTCSNFDISVNTLGLKNVANSYDVLESQSYLITYLSVFAKNPAIGAMAHIQRSRGVLPPFMFQPPDNMVPLDVTIPVGEGTNPALQTGPSLLHPSNDVQSEVSKKPKLLKILEFPVQASAFLMNQASWFWGWGGLWLLIGFLVLLVIYRQVRIWELFVMLYPIIVMHLALLYFIPSSNPRYYMYSIFFGTILSLHFVVVSFERRKLNYNSE